jgi:uncharacterized SAM-binding protein YcdF (DUF218 family)
MPRTGAASGGVYGLSGPGAKDSDIRASRLARTQAPYRLAFFSDGISGLDHGSHPGIHCGELKPVQTPVVFFYLSKLLSGILFPYPLFLIVCLIAAWQMPKTARIRPVFRIAVIAFYMLSINPVSGWLIGILEERHVYQSLQTAPTADAIVVLSGMVDPLTGIGDRPEFLSSGDRILAAEELWRAKKAPQIVISGGSGLILQTGESEARILERWLTARGVPVMAETDSRNTAENAIETAKIAHREGWRRILLVTSAFHMPRSIACFRKAAPHLQIAPYPVDYYRSRDWPGPEAFFPASGAMGVSTMAVKEYIGLIAYWLRGYI